MMAIALVAEVKTLRIRLGSQLYLSFKLNATNISVQTKIYAKKPAKSHGNIIPAKDL